MTRIQKIWWFLFGAILGILFLTFCIQMAAPAWAGENPCAKVDWIERRISWIGSFSDMGPPSAVGSYIAEKEILLKQYEYYLNKCEEIKTSSPGRLSIEVPDMNGDKVIDEKDKEIAIRLLNCFNN